MGRWSPTVDAHPGDWGAALGGIADAYSGAQDRKYRRKRDEEDRKERDIDRKERQKDREENRKDREESRKIQRAQLALQGIFLGDDLPAESGNDTVEKFTPPVDFGLQPEQMGPNAAHRGDPFADFEGFLQGVPGQMSPSTAQPSVAKPKPAGAFDPLTGTFSKAQRIPLGGGMFYDPSIEAARKEAQRQAELSTYRGKKEIDNELDPPTYHPKTRAEWLRDMEATQQAQYRWSKAGQGGGSGSGGDGEGGGGAGTVSAGEKRRDDMASEFATRYVNMFYGNVPKAVAYIEQRPDLKKQATRLGVTLAHYNNATVMRSQPGKAPNETASDATPPSGPITRGASAFSDAAAGTSRSPTRPVTAPSAPKAPEPKDVVRAERVQKGIQIARQYKQTAADVDEQVKRGRLTPAEGAQIKAAIGAK